MVTLLLYLMDLNTWFHSGKPASHPLMEHPPPLPFAPPPLNLSATVFSPTSGFTMLLMATGYPPLNFPRINGKP